MSKCRARRRFAAHPSASARRRGKRALPSGIKHQAVRITLSPAAIAAVRRRQAAAAMAGLRTSFSGELARCVEEADGNHRRLRHDTRTHLNAISLAEAALREKRVRTPDESELLQIIRRGVASMTALLQPASAGA